jgi:hypothetical protein
MERLTELEAHNRASWTRPGNAPETQEFEDALATDGPSESRLSGPAVGHLSMARHLPGQPVRPLPGSARM